MNADTSQTNEAIDLETYAKTGKTPPPAKQYRIRIDKDYKMVDVASMTGREILALVGKTPASHLLSQKIHGAIVKVGSDEVVSFTKPGIERFQTLALDATEG